MIAAVALYLVMPILGVAVALSFVRLARGPSLPDRVVALDLISSVGIGMIGAYVALTSQAVFVDVALVISLITFLGTVALANYLEWRR